MLRVILLPPLIFQILTVELTVPRLPLRIAFNVALMPYVYQIALFVVLNTAVLDRLLNVRRVLNLLMPGNKFVPAIRMRQSVTVFQYRFEKSRKAFVPSKGD